MTQDLMPGAWKELVNPEWGWKRSQTVRLSAIKRASMNFFAMPVHHCRNPELKKSHCLVQNTTQRDWQPMKEAPNM